MLDQRPWVVVVAVLLVLALAFGGGFYVRGAIADADMAEARADWAKEREEAAIKLAAAQAALRTQEQAIATAIAESATKFQEAKNDARTTENKLLADLRGDNVRLRKLWAGCNTTRSSEAAARRHEPDDTAQLRAESAARIVRHVDTCDAHVAGLQAVIRAERKVNHGRD